eukprot:2058335-Rhodomonas_salina.1
MSCLTREEVGHAAPPTALRKGKATQNKRGASRRGAVLERTTKRSSEARQCSGASSPPMPHWTGRSSVGRAFDELVYVTDCLHLTGPVGESRSWGDSFEESFRRLEAFKQKDGLCAHKNVEQCCVFSDMLRDLS